MTLDIHRITLHRRRRGTVIIQVTDKASRDGAAVGGAVRAVGDRATRGFHLVIGDLARLTEAADDGARWMDMLFIVILGRGIDQVTHDPTDDAADGAFPLHCIIRRHDARARGDLILRQAAAVDPADDAARIDDGMLGGGIALLIVIRIDSRRDDHFVPRDRASAHKSDETADVTRHTFAISFRLDTARDIHIALGHGAVIYSDHSPNCEVGFGLGF